MSDAGRALALGHLAVQAQTVRVVKALREAGVDCVLLKGVGYEPWLYPDGTRPVSRDVDVLIAPEELDFACQTVSELGMKPARDLAGPRRVGNELRFVPGNGTGVPVELHPSFHFVQVPAERCWALVSAELEQIELGGIKIDVPSLPARAALLALHVAAHGRTADWAIEDLRRALVAVSLEEWRQAAAMAEGLGALAAFSSGLRFLPAGREVADTLALTEPDDPILLLHAQSGDEPAFRMLDYAGLPRLTGLARLLRTELIPSADGMRTWYPLARRGPRGLLGAHVLRLARLAVSSPQLIGRWRQARAASRAAND